MRSSHKRLNQTQPLPPPPHTFRDLKKHSKQQLPRTQRPVMWDASSVESSGSELSCGEKKFYRCGCMDGHCHHRYPNYLPQLRQQRMQRASSTSELGTPSRASLSSILEREQSAEYSRKKQQHSISVCIDGKHYAGQLNQEQALKLIERLSAFVGRE